MRRALAAVVLAVGVAAFAQDAGIQSELAAIRERITALDLEGAVAASSRLLERPDLTDADRADALALRAGAHVAAGELDAAEKDYKSILPLRPDFSPDPALTTKKSMERLSRLQASMIGSVHLDLDPPDAHLTVDDRPVVATSGTLKVVAGDRRVRAERAGFDPFETAVHAVAGAETLVQLRLVPNARDLLVRTDIPGVQVLVDGAPAGETAASASGGAALLVPALSIGEHAVELRKSCFATESLPAMINVDLSDRSPKALSPVAMRPAAARITPAGARYTGELRVDGRDVATLPAETFTVCPGSRAIEVVASGRVVWSGTIEAEESDRTLDLSPRPNVVLVGDEWPEAWRDFAGSVSLRGRVARDAAWNLRTPSGWKDVALPPDTDLAVAVLGGKLPGDRAEVWLYGPATRTAAEAEAPPAPSGSRWSASRIDASVVDADGGVLVAGVAPDGGAAHAGLAAGDRIMALGEKTVGSAAQLAAGLDAATPGTPVSLKVASPAGEERTLSVPVLLDPRVSVPSDPVAALVRGAWAASEGAAGGPDAAAALATLAVLLEREQLTGPAAEAWRRAKALDPGSFGVRADYALAADLAARGKKSDAIELFQRARASAAARGDLVLAAAASDHLADLGVSAP